MFDLSVGGVYYESIERVYVLIIGDFIKPCYAPAIEYSDKELTKIVSVGIRNLTYHILPLNAARPVAILSEDEVKRHNEKANMTYKGAIREKHHRQHR